MKDNEIDREESRLAELLSALGGDAAPVDGEHLRRLREESTTAFQAAFKQTGKKRRRDVILFRRIIPAAVAACLVGLLAVVLVTGIADNSNIAWGDVQAAFNNVKTLCFKMQVDGSAQSYTATVYYKVPQQMRMEVPEMVTIFDWQQSQCLALNPSNKMAHFTNWQGVPGFQDDWYDELKDIIDSDKASDAGTRQINGREAIGWSVPAVGDPSGATTVTVWADAETAELIEVVRSAQQRTVMSDFKTNVELDDSLFSMTPPQGYQVGSADIDYKDAGLEDVAVLLRVWAGGNGGVFPDNLNPWEFASAVRKYDWKNEFEGLSDEQAEAKQMQMKDAMHRAFTWIGVHGDYVYKGQGVEVGSADVPVLWYTPAGADTATVIYGDLSVRQVPAEQMSN